LGASSLFSHDETPSDIDSLTSDHSTWLQMGDQGIPARPMNSFVSFFVLEQKALLFAGGG